MNKGDKFKYTFEETELVYNGFIDTFNDKNPLHTDDSYARKKGFSAKVMHGNILNGFLSFFVGECLPVKNVIIHSQKINYKKPAYLNDTLEFSAKIEEIHKSVNVYIFKFLFKNQNNEKVAGGEIQIGLTQ